MVWAPENLFKRHLPFVLLTGFLGSGKTTLLNAMLQDPRMADTAIAINEFGDIGLDQNFVTASNDEVILLANGCMCCLATDDLSASLERILQRGSDGTLPEFKRLIIETSGLADPEMVLQSIVDNPVASRFLWLDRIVTTVDAIYGLEQLAQHSEAFKQAALADCFVVSKADLVDDERLREICGALRRINPRAELVIGRTGEIETARLFSPSFFEEKDASFIGSWVARQAELRGEHHHHDGESCGHDHHHDQHCTVDHGRQTHAHTAGIESVSLLAETPLNWRSFSLWLGQQQRAYGARLLRVKGILNVADSEEPVVVHAVQSTLHVPVSLEQWPDADRRTRIVFILRDMPGRELRQAWDAFLSDQISMVGSL